MLGFAGAAVFHRLERLLNGRKSWLLHALGDFKLSKLTETKHHRRGPTAKLHVMQPMEPCISTD
jgi:hypothetical protein